MLCSFEAFITKQIKRCGMLFHSDRKRDEMARNNDSIKAQLSLYDYTGLFVWEQSKFQPSLRRKKCVYKKNSLTEPEVKEMDLLYFHFKISRVRRTYITPAARTYVCWLVSFDREETNLWCGTRKQHSLSMTFLLPPISKSPKILPWRL